MGSAAAALLIAAAAVAVVDWWATAGDRRSVRVVSKPLTTLLLIGVAATAGDPDAATRALIVLAAGFGLAGDVALLGDGESAFLAGLGSFAVGHALYVAAALTVGLNLSQAILVLPFLGVLMGWRFVPETVPAARRDGGPVLMGAVLFYAVIISAMVFTASGTGRVLAVVGAMCFAASDWLLGYVRFVRTLRNGHVAVMVTYHVGQALLILGLAMNWPFA